MGPGEERRGAMLETPNHGRRNNVFAKKKKQALLQHEVWVLTIDEGKHRYLKTRQRLNELGIGVRPFHGVSRYEKRPEGHSLHTAEPGYTLSDGAIAVGMSHIFLWSEVVRSGLPGVIVLEDDAIPQSQYSEMVEAFDTLPLCDFASLHSWGVTLQETDTREISNPHWWRTRHCANTLVAYYVSAEGALKLLRSCIPFWQPIDQMVQKACSTPGFRAFQVKTPLFNADYTMGSLINDDES